ncbi:MAG: phosphate ABC transporter ATP-binding protein [Gammaproteobacteria bacterium]
MNAHPDPVIECRGLSVFRGHAPLVTGIELGFGRNEVTAIVGAPGAGKTALLKALNRMVDLDTEMRTVGQVLLDGEDVRGAGVDVLALRARVVLVPARPTAFRMSVFDNVAYGARLHGLARDRTELEQRVRDSLSTAGLFDEVRGQLAAACDGLRPEQLHRLCIARALALEPQVLLFEDPCRGLDPTAAARIEDLVHQLSSRQSIIFTAQSMQMAGRVAQRIAFLHAGRLVEVNAADELLTTPRQRLTEAYVTGRVA